tara:strand:+ start:2520 stop:2951 length:432 start_codon:yes stop_codon:yes gene_type:complete
MKIYEIYKLIRTRCQGKKEKKETEYYDGPYYCPETAKEELDELNKEKKSTRHIIKEKTEIHTSFQVYKREANNIEKDQYLQDEWEMAQTEIEEKEEEEKEDKATIIKPKKKKTVIEDDEKRTRLTIFPQTKEDEPCLEAQIPY